MDLSFTVKYSGVDVLISKRVIFYLILIILIYWIFAPSSAERYVKKEIIPKDDGAKISIEKIIRDLDYKINTDGLICVLGGYSSSYHFSSENKRGKKFLIALDKYKKSGFEVVTGEDAWQIVFLDDNSKISSIQINNYLIDVDLSRMNGICLESENAYFIVKKSNGKIILNFYREKL